MEGSVTFTYPSPLSSVILTNESWSCNVVSILTHIALGSNSIEGADVGSSVVGSLVVGLTEGSDVVGLPVGRSDGLGAASGSRVGCVEEAIKEKRND